jgi:hypothetical protein
VEEVLVLLELVQADRKRVLAELVLLFHGYQRLLEQHFLQG